MIFSGFQHNQFLYKTITQCKTTSPMLPASQAGSQRPQQLARMWDGGRQGETITAEPGRFRNFLKYGKSMHFWGHPKGL